ncbi:MAG: hypothetical protein HY735_29130 [Verrucomicrobia bacterium]|nr:hypothetical protein [Verrucomicrobiota bacterium]
MPVPTLRGTGFNSRSVSASVFTVSSEWETQKRGQFDDRWPEVQRVLAALEELGIHMLDVSPSNIAFLN